MLARNAAKRRQLRRASRVSSRSPPSGPILKCDFGGGPSGAFGVHPLVQPLRVLGDVVRDGEPEQDEIGLIAPSVGLEEQQLVVGAEAREPRVHDLGASAVLGELCLQALGERLLERHLHAFDEGIAENEDTRHPSCRRPRMLFIAKAVGVDAG